MRIDFIVKRPALTNSYIVKINIVDVIFDHDKWLLMVTARYLAVET